MSLGSINLDIKSTKALLARFSSNRAIMLRGRHGIGKSQVVYQIAGDLRHDFYKDRGNCERVSAALAKDSGFVKMVASFWKRNGSNVAYADLPRNVWHYDMGIPSSSTSLTVRSRVSSKPPSSLPTARLSMATVCMRELVSWLRSISGISTMLPRWTLRL